MIQGALFILNVILKSFIIWGLKMFRFRLFIISTIIWLAFVLNLEAILNNLEIPIHIQAFVYVLAIGTVICMMLFLQLRDYQPSVIVSTLLLSYAIGKVIFPADFDFTDIAMELVLVLGTYFVTRPVTNWLADYSNNLKKAVFNPMNTLLKNNQHSIEAVERKISLARRFGRELNLIYIPMNDKLRAYHGMKVLALQAKINELLNVLVSDTGLYAWHDGNLMICLQETSVEELGNITTQFSALITDVLKTQVQLGTANFPTQGLIMDDLIATASANLGQEIQPDESTETIQFFPKPVRPAQSISA